MVGPDVWLDVAYVFLFVSLYFEVFLLVAFIEYLTTRSEAAERGAAYRGEWPRVAIIIPCFNEEKTVSATVKSLLSLEYPRDLLEIIIVDDGSTDGTWPIIHSFGQHPQVKVFHKENGGKHTAMNFALAHTQAEIIGCLDADSTVAPDALMHVIPAFNNPLIAAVTPGIHVREPETIMQHMQHVEYRLSIFNRFILSALGAAYITPGPFSLFRADIVRELGGWRHAHSTEDMEMALRMQEAGYLIANAPAAVVYTGTPRTFPALFRQRVRWTYGFLRNTLDYRHMLGNRSYGNLGLLILPWSLISIGIGLYFFFRMLWSEGSDLYHTYTFMHLTHGVPHPSLDPFYFNTSAMWFIIFSSVGVVLVLISAGSWIGTGSRRPPASTPLFLFLYCFLVPIWLLAAVYRAFIGQGVRWR